MKTVRLKGNQVTQMNKLVKKISGVTGYFSIVLALVIGLAYGVFLLRRGNLPEPSEYFKSNEYLSIRHVPAQTLRRVGYIHDYAASCFAKFEQPKAEGVVRVCCFGDSFTAGTEVSEHNDYPTLLHRESFKQGLLNVEVLNFGVAGFGFHQAYILWEEVGTLFDPDIILIGPQCFQWERDMTFHGPDFIAPMHSRFILTGDSLRRIDPVGDTPKDRYLISRRFIPRYRYLRYDWVIPALLRTFLPLEPTIAKNPFYYSDQPLPEEALASYCKMLHQMAEKTKQLVVLHTDPELVSRFNSLAIDNVAAVLYHKQALLQFPNVAPAWHYGPCGNLLIAKILLGLLKGADELALPLVKEATPVTSSLGTAKPLSEYDEVGVAINRQVIGRFVSHANSPLPAIPKNLKETNARSLLVLRTQDYNLMNCAYIPVDFELTGSEPVNAVVELAGKRSAHRLGDLQLIGPGNIGVLELPQMIQTAEFILKFGDSFELLAYLFANVKATSVEITVNGVPVIEAKPQDLHDEPWPGFTYVQEAKLQPVQGRILHVCSDPDGLVDLSELPSSGQIELFLADSEGGSYFPFGLYRTTLERFIENPKPLKVML